MNREHSSGEKHSNRLLLIVIITVFATILVCAFLTSHQFKRMLMTQEERIEDTLKKKTAPIVGDSVQTARKKVDVRTFDSEYSAESWYSDYKSNKVAFDKEYDEKKLDIHGTIDKISNDEGCAQISMKGETGGILTYIEFTNCRGGKDNWSDEVALTAVGQDVHIRGIYSGLLSSSGFEMRLYNCHIIK